MLTVIIIKTTYQKKMKKIENAIDVGFYSDYKKEEDEDGTKYYDPIDHLESTIKARNKDGWKLVNTNVHPFRKY